MSEKQKISATKIQDFFTMFPNLIDDSDLDVYEFRLLAHYYRVGNCWQSTVTTAGICKMSKPQVVAKRQSLASKGWITIRRGSAQDTLSIEVVDKWTENHKKYGGDKKKDPPYMAHEKESGKPPDQQGVAILTGGGQDVDSNKNPINKTTIKNINTDAPNGAIPDLTYEPIINNGETEYKEPRKTKRKQPTYQHPALKLFRGIARKYVPIAWQDKVVEVVGDDPAKLNEWSVLITDWIGKGWNPGNVKGMLEAFQSGGIKPRNQNSSETIETRLQRIGLHESDS